MPRAAATRTPPKELSLPDATWLHTFRRGLLAWYRRHHRDLPWRRTRDPYCIWVSEIMLQQTQVATVIPVLRAVPGPLSGLPALAAADEHDVLRHWEGLGYYRRARQLHAAARQIVERHAGAVSRDQSDDVRRLAGIGRYTAGAIVSIAFDRPAPILEANTHPALQPAVGLSRRHVPAAAARNCCGGSPSDFCRAAGPARSTRP